MADIDKSRSLEFDRSSSGLSIKIPITSPTAMWSAAVKRLSREHQVDLVITRDRSYLFLSVGPGTNADDLVARLNRFMNWFTRQTRWNAMNSTPRRRSRRQRWNGGNGPDVRDT